MDKQKVEITDELIETALKCGHCGLCSMSKNSPNIGDCVRRLAAALKAEREERKLNPGVWDGKIDWESRPWATEVRIAYCSKDCDPDKIGDRIATINRPKSKAREIAEEESDKMIDLFSKLAEKYISDAIKAAILEYAKETK